MQILKSYDVLKFRVLRFILLTLFKWGKTELPDCLSKLKRNQGDCIEQRLLEQVFLLRFFMVTFEANLGSQTNLGEPLGDQ